MRIVFVTPDYPDENSLSGSGVGTFVYNISHGLAEFGHDSIVLVHGQPENHSKKIGEHIIVRYLKHVGNIHYYVSKLPLIGRSSILIGLIKQWEIGQTVLAELLIVLKETGTKDIILESPEGHGNFLLANRNRIIPYIISIHGSVILHKQAIGQNKGFLLWMLAKINEKIMQGASAIICPSRFTTEFYTRFFKKNVFYCPNPVSLPAITDKKPELTLPHNPVVVLSVSALSWSKGTDILRDAIVKISQVTRNIQFVIVGADSDIKKKDLESFFGAHQLLDLVNIVGYVPWGEIVEWYKSCDVFVSASRFETFGQTIAEAMLSEKPVIATNIGAIPELLNNGKSGILVEPGDSSALAQEILELAGDLKKRRELGSKGMEKILAENSPVRAIQERISLYQNILDESKNKAIYLINKSV